MRITPDYISQSLTVSLKTEAMLMKIKDKHYFIEYPVNILPNPRNLFVKGNRVVLVTDKQFELLKTCFEDYINIKQVKPFIHAPTFIIAYLLFNSVDAELLGL